MYGLYSVAPVVSENTIKYNCPNRMFARLAKSYGIPGSEAPMAPISYLPPVTMESPQKALPASSVDELLAMKNPGAANAEKVAGWMAAPPAPGVPLSTVTEGAIGTVEGPLSRDDYPVLKKWFFDTELAKKELLLAKCNALQTDREAFQAYQATSLGEGVPVDTAGTLLYGTNTLVTSRSDTVDPCSTKRIERPTEGRQMPADILQRPVLMTGGSDVGIRPVALGIMVETPHESVPPLGVNHESVKIFHRVTQPPMRMDTVRHGAAGAEHVLRVVGDSDQKTKEDVVVTQRDPLFQAGTLQDFNFCADVPDSTRPPFRIECLQHLFRGVGGLPAGRSYPGEATMALYDMMQDLGEVKQYFHLLAKNAKSEDAAVRERAMQDFFGISVQAAVRAPYHPGVEVFWFIPVHGQPNQVAGFLKRTVEHDLVLFDDTRRVPHLQDGVGKSTAGITMMQLTDVRAKLDVALRFAVAVDHGFFVAVNQAAAVDRQVFESLHEDKPGLFANVEDGANTYVSEERTLFVKDRPNVMKVFYEDADGGDHTFRLGMLALTSDSSETPFAFDKAQYSLTCEPRAPFLTYEVNRTTMEFQERRNPGLFAQLLGRNGLEYHVRPEEARGVPGEKGFVRMNSASSLLRFSSLAYASWGTVTMAIRLMSMPVKETVLYFRMGERYYSIVVRPDSGSVAKVLIEHNVAGKPKILETVFRMELKTWYVVMVQNQVSSLRLAVQSVAEMSRQRGVVSATTVEMGAPTTSAMSEVIGPCSVSVGTHGSTGWPSVYGSTSCFYDIAWVHFFDYVVSANDLYREARADWVYTMNV